MIRKKIKERMNNKSWLMMNTKQDVPVAVFPATKRYFVWLSNEANNLMSWFNESGRYQLSSWSIPLLILSLHAGVPSSFGTPLHLFEQVELLWHCLAIRHLSRSFWTHIQWKKDVVANHCSYLRIGIIKSLVLLTSRSMHWDFSSGGASVAKVLKASIMGR